MTEHAPVPPPALSLTPENIQKLEQLKRELTTLQVAMQNIQDKSPYEIEGRIRQYQDKEGEIKRFLRSIGLEA
ncbi:MAG: hypothetical protein HQM02_02670 [Magnetococcales bacterium]|nr:hypothetical protein [Magnetococcales bacterium]